MVAMPTTAADRLRASQPYFAAALALWYRDEARPLPWREAPSLYKTVVSEFMLQQTQVKTVLPYFARWLGALPDFAALAGASETKVLKLWEGLGYYSRARNLQRLAQALVSQAEIPQSPEAWQELPGVGPYTAAAVTSIAFGVPTACVDGNVVRILARLTADGRAFRDSASAAKLLAPLAQALMPAVAPGDHNQAMMELGATICLRQNPLCSACPVLAFCAAGQRGNPEDYPRLAARKIERQVVTRVWCERGGSLLLHRAQAGARRLAGQHELPTAAQAGLTDAAAGRGRLLARKKRAITRFQIVESIYAAPPPRRLPAGLVWAPLAELDALVLSGPHRRWVGEILRGRKKA